MPIAKPGCYDLCFPEETMARTRLNTNERRRGIEFCYQDTRDDKPLWTIGPNKCILVIYLLSARYAFKCIAAVVVR